MRLLFRFCFALFHFFYVFLIFYISGNSTKKNQHLMIAFSITKHQPLLHLRVSVVLSILLSKLFAIKSFENVTRCEVEVSPKEEGFKGSWFRAILEQNPTKVKGEKLRICYKTFLNEDGSKPCSESIERCFIRVVPPEILNESVVFKEGSVVDAYFSDGCWNGVIIVERPDGNFLVYFDDPPDIIRFNRSQLRPHADWIGSKWVKSKNKYTLPENVEAFVGYGWRKGVVREIHEDNQYKVCFMDTKEEAVFKSSDIRRLMEWQDGVWIHAHMVVVKCILGDPEMCSNLVEDVDTQFESVVDLVQRGYRLKRQDWHNGGVNVAVAEAEVEKNNYGPGIDATDKDKIVFLTKQVTTLKERVEYLEDLLDIRRETEKVL
ncbi:hypothetical protein Bca52824_026695 [Brassica carinata]|uniref:Agenet domain-containing protein n=1 Tax=Brassica carinata TaxID=52824 RepID=A0A8X7V993_BRACI|nr:hypothetical protein Bca52824_026695 [Brassica carinata]